MQAYRIKKGVKKPTLKERKRMQEARDMRKLEQRGIEFDTSSLDRRVELIHRKAEFMTKSEMERELAIGNFTGDPKTMDHTNADTTSQVPAIKLGLADF